MALGAEVVDLARIDVLHQSHQTGGVGEIAIMELESDTPIMGVLIDVINPAGVETGGAPDNAVDLVTFLEE